MRESSWRNQNRRKKDFSKARRKRNICRQVYTNGDWYDNLHRYSKNKIHCSCQMCRFRSGWDPDRKPMADLRRIEGMKYKQSEYDRMIAHICRIANEPVYRWPKKESDQT